MIDVFVEWKESQSVQHWDDMCDWVYDKFGEINLTSSFDGGVFTFKTEKQAVEFILRWL